ADRNPRCQRPDDDSVAVVAACDGLPPWFCLDSPRPHSCKWGRDPVMPWSTQTETASAGDDELRMIPRWSMVLAVILFVAMQYLFHGVLPHHRHEMLPMRVMMGYTWGALVASYVLLLGYVSRDSKR